MNGLLVRLMVFGIMVATLAGAAQGAEPITADPYAQNACVQCHRDLPGRSSRIVDLEWKQSVHYAANVGCEGCHGGDALVKRDQFQTQEAFKRAAHQRRNPQFFNMQHTSDEFVSAVRGRSVSYFCGKCHAQIKEKHLGSPHGDFGDPTCLYCHGQGSHKITDADVSIIDTRSRSEGGRCSLCHTASTNQSVARIKTKLLDTQKRIESSGRVYQQLESWGYRNLELEELHHHAEQIHSQLRQIFHSFNMRDVNNFAAEIEDVAERTSATFELVEHLRRVQRNQTRIGLAAVLLLLSLAGLLVFYKHVYLDAQ